jgi:hypothetical protein
VPPFKRLRRHSAHPSAGFETDTALDAPTEPINTYRVARAIEHNEFEHAKDAGRPSETTTQISAVVGPLKIPQIQVGPPSPTVEPQATAAGFRTFPFRPDVVIDGWSTDAITIRGVSQRGHLHRYNGAPRQDDFAVHQLSGQRTIILVADGVSAAPQSHLGASAAIKYAASWLRDRLPEDVAQTDWLMLIKSVAWGLSEQAQTLLNLDQPDPIRTEQELATTLVCAVIEPTTSGTLRAFLLGVGDSGAWLLSDGRFSEVLGGKAPSNSEIASSAVTALPWVPNEIAPVVIEIAHGDTLLIGTDGIGDPLGTGEGGVGNLLRSVVGAPTPPTLVEFAHAVDFSREMFDDDRTLVAVWARRKGTPRYAKSESHTDDTGV